MPLGAHCWVDLSTSDPARAQAFYGELFGWTVEVNEDFGGYMNFSSNGRMVAGGMGKMPDDTTPDGWGLYIAVADAEATVAKAAASGGAAVMPPMPVGDLGQMAFVTDPGGAQIGLWQQGLHRGFGVTQDAGSPVWFELHTRNYATCVEFYRDVFGADVQTMSDEPDFKYSTFGEGEASTAGIMDASAFPPEAPSSWSVYFAVADADATVALAESLGGSLVMPIDDTPYGRLGMLTDPMGAMFKIRQHTPG